MTRERTLEMLEARVEELEDTEKRVKAAIKELYKVVLYDAPPLDKTDAMYEEGDENAPFFTEAYLYNLLGKEEARTVLAMLHKVEEPLNLRDGEFLLQRRR